MKMAVFQLKDASLSASCRLRLHRLALALLHRLPVLALESLGAVLVELQLGDLNLQGPGKI